MFENRRLLIATKHTKEKVIAPILEKNLGVTCFIVPNLDTDVFGTFSGEVERKEDAFTTARNKCLDAMKIANCDLAISSEGSFGPHPNLFLLPANDELLLLIDQKLELEISVRELSTQTNFNGIEIKTLQELRQFAKNTKFPSHGLIIKDNQSHFKEVVKGITDANTLDKTFKYFLSNYGKAFVETDMRAMHNPSRMKVIEKATKQLVRKVKKVCPKCNTPGFGISSSNMGLPCSLCNSPTRGILNHVYSCQKCSFSITKEFPNKIFTEDPLYCDHCNP